VAAVLIPLIGATFLYLFITRHKNAQHSALPVEVASTKIIPGGSHAVLTLANGRQISLDSAAIGDIANQGNIQIIKTANGRLTYKNAGQTNAADGLLAYNTVSTPRGGQYQVTLPDGTQVWLNSASSIKFPTAVNGAAREVFLSGEAYFEVMKRAANNKMGKQSFVVTMNSGMKVTVFGTKFNIMGYDDETAIKTSLLEGSVQVSAAGDKVMIVPGKQAVLNHADNSFNVVDADFSEVLAWKNGEFRFNNVNIKAIMRQLERWYDIRVEYKGNVENIYLSGVIPRKGDIEQLLDVFETAGKIHFDITGNKVIASPK
jgi:ferric-dicitrate binding protein FerR (iron transport regulator)